MTQFIFKLDGREIDPAIISDQTSKQSYSNLTSIINNHVEQITCPTHHLGPIFVLHNEGSRAVISGFGGCCEDFGSRIKSILDKAGYQINNWATTTMTTSITM